MTEKIDLGVMAEVHQQCIDGLITKEECFDHPEYKVPALLGLVGECEKLISEGVYNYDQYRQDKASPWWPNYPWYERARKFLSRLSGKGE